MGEPIYREKILNSRDRCLGGNLRRKVGEEKYLAAGNVVRPTSGCEGAQGCIPRRRRTWGAAAWSWLTT